ncbi:hypothetical protein [Mesorhizobium sp. WSM4306]|uniref:hypothetical protein n=1 Tax=unclassified Mesorhizobium TaxID=325217 RepID=UPI0032B2CDF2
MTVAQLRRKMRIGDTTFYLDAAMPLGKIMLCAAAMTVAATNFADARPDTRKMTCAQTQATIQSQHAAVLSTGPNTYDRYVRQFGNECDAPSLPMAEYVPASDGQCRVYRCEEASPMVPN